MQRAKLLKLANFLQRLPKKYKFDLNRWSTKDQEDDCECKSTACAVGWYCSKVAPRSNLKLVYNVFHNPNDAEVVYSTKNGMMYYGWYAVEVYFGLTEEEAEYLFHNCSYKLQDETNPKAVAKRIKQFLKDRQVH